MISSDGSESGVSLCGWLNSMGYRSPVVVTAYHDTVEVAAQLGYRR